MEINDTLEEIRAADFIPDDHYKLIVASTQTPKSTEDNSWAKLIVKIVASKDPQNAHMIDKELQFWVISQRDGRKGLGDFLQHKHLYDPEGGWDKGIPENAEGKKHLHHLVGIPFDARVVPFEFKSGEKAGTWGYNINPILQPDQPMLEIPEGTTPF
jgi:hypothetical protein